MKKSKLLVWLVAIAVIIGTLSACSYFAPRQDVPSQGIPGFSGEAYAVVDDNQPAFTEDELTIEAYEYYSRLDQLGRCGYAMACIGQELMPTQDRGSIGQVKPSGWQTVKYDFVDGKYLYNRCHLIGYQLTGENANEQNLITGTRYLNVEGMLPFENMVADYIKETGNHVLYRVTPEFTGSELVARGVRIEGYSVEDNGAGICFHVYAYNTQPGVTIDYQTGKSELAQQQTQATEHEEKQEQFVLNTNSKKFHSPDCSRGQDISPEKRQVYAGQRSALMADGYQAAGCCNP